MVSFGRKVMWFADGLPDEVMGYSESGWLLIFGVGVWVDSGSIYWKFGEESLDSTKHKIKALLSETV